MQKTISETAVRIAKAGAAKMIGKYTFHLFPYSTVAGTIKKYDGTTYKLNTHTGMCGCPFHAKEGYCKHLEFVKAELEWEAHHEAEYEAKEAARGELESLRY